MKHDHAVATLAAAAEVAAHNAPIHAAAGDVAQAALSAAVAADCRDAVERLPTVEAPVA